MYEHDYDECANEEQFTEETLQDGLPAAHHRRL